MKIAVTGSGISGLSCAYQLAQDGYDVTLFEANDYFGGHTHTVDVTLDGISYGVDTGFLVFNHKTYPNLVRLFAELEVETVATDMSFSVKLPLAQRTLEWAGGDLDAVFAQRRNLLSPGFYRMLRDILRFNREATRMALASQQMGMQASLGSYLQREHYSSEFRNWYLLPMAGCIWSCPTEQMLDFPVSSFVRFCHNHGLLQVSDRPQWYTVKGGARHYADKMLAQIPQKYLNTPVKAVTRISQGNFSKVKIETNNGAHLFDHVVMASHSDQTLRLLSDATPAETAVLSAIKYQPNHAVLHTDSSCLPANKNTWSAWNYESEQGNKPSVCVHYLINQLQPLPFRQPVIVSLNPLRPVAAECVIDTFEYEHPVFDEAAVAAQRKLATIQGQRNTWFAGAWTGYGFHEDGLTSGLNVARAIGKTIAYAPLKREAA
ncbi:MAG: NAD/FAD-binding protein [Gallionellales bacterium 35-53-114]|jgi:predicted NAD/FAD-binding protein|nr:MAG: NAD/FAD-binding protein [Gallionellales bacterium 35-53-114]OYZ63032.1 MAG: NAD/FAD-binding protein [Gallionellales bacterium 24-53-125]OZB08986.1 MAG: NAD/FAD-binding protein [Gallionellales bacterium 39-52-133]HQS59336.1 FAD-dependent oxidoreductase [Gallionellaceae bacterium]HQS76249.1 FAD-dependent oxidoreductase [Gallionellaceae bacterium]